MNSGLIFNTNNAREIFADGYSLDNSGIIFYYKDVEEFP
jgi:hypothetical protein